MNKILKCAVASLATLAASCALGQSSPGFSYGQVATPGQWNNYFAGKLDYTAPGTVGNVLQSNGITWYSGPIAASLLPLGTSVNNPGTGTLESLIRVQTVTGASYNFATADLFKKTRRSNAGSAMTDTLPTSTATGVSNGTQINIVNADATATDTITAGAGTTIGGNSTFTIQPGRDMWWTYDAANTEWRAVANTGSSVLLSGTAATASQLYGGNAIPGDASAVTVGTGCTLTSSTLNCSGSGGTVTSVGMTVPSWLTVTGSPITGAGTLAVSATTGETANQFLATPNGTTGALSPRAIVGADLPKPPHRA